MIFGIGVDLCDSRRIADLLGRHGSRFERRLCSGHELERLNRASHRPLALAKCFAAKEAVAKAMGTGIRGFQFKDIEISRNELGKPHVRLHPMALTRLHTIIGETTGFRFHLSLSDEGALVVAYAILETHDKDFI